MKPLKKICFLAVIASTVFSCKVLNPTGDSDEKSLDNLASTEWKPNSCGINQAENHELVEAVMKKIDGGPRDALKKVLNAAPTAMLESFDGQGGIIEFKEGAPEACKKAQGEHLGNENGGYPAPIFCLTLGPKNSPLISIGTDDTYGQEEMTRHGLLRLIIMAYSEILFNPEISKALEQNNDSVANQLKLVADLESQFLRDLKRREEIPGFVSEADFKSRYADPEVRKRMLYVDAHDSYYCDRDNSAKTEKVFSGKTHNVFKSCFPYSYSVMSGDGIVAKDLSMEDDVCPAALKARG